MRRDLEANRALDLRRRLFGLLPATVLHSLVLALLTLLTANVALADQSTNEPQPFSADAEFDAILRIINPLGSSDISALRLFETPIRPLVTVITEQGEVHSFGLKHSLPTNRDSSQRLLNYTLEIFEEMGVLPRSDGNQDNLVGRSERDTNVFLTVDANNGTLFQVARGDLYVDGIAESADRHYYPESLRRALLKFMASRVPSSKLLYTSIPWGYVLFEVRDAVVLRSMTWVSLAQFNLVQTGYGRVLDGVPFEAVRAYRRRGSIFEAIRALGATGSLNGKLAEHIPAITRLDMSLWDYTLALMLTDWPGGSIFNGSRFYYLRRAVLASAGLSGSAWMPAEQLIKDILTKPPRDTIGLLEHELFSAAYKAEADCSHNDLSIMRSGASFVRSLTDIRRKTSANAEELGIDRLRRQFRQSYNPNFDWDIRTNLRLKRQLCRADFSLMSAPIRFCCDSGCGPRPHLGVRRGWPVDRCSPTLRPPALSAPEKHRFSISPH